jgi:hypothetical protein
MPDPRHDQAEAEAREADASPGLTAYRHQWSRDLPSWQITADIDPIPEADMF